MGETACLVPVLSAREACFHIVQVGLGLQEGAMSRITHLGFAAAFAIFPANTAPAKAEISLISAWQHCEPVKGCLKFAFLPNGRVIKQYPLAGSVVTAYGRYHIRG